MTLSAKNIAAIRKDYQLSELNETMTGDDPLAFFQKWFAEAEVAKVDEVNAMTLATVDGNNKPHARIVLLKGLDQSGFVFFTNYNSHKGTQISSNPNAALVFFWKELERQIRIEGLIERVGDSENDNYFNSRPEASRIGAWSSPQSQVIPNRDILEYNFKKYSDDFSSQIPRPEHWGGYRLIPSTIEFWQGRASRLHDRILFERNNEGIWQKCRLAP